MWPSGRREREATSEGSMAGKRKAEGIALLSVYGGDDDDAASQASVDEEEDEVTPEKQVASSEAVQRYENASAAASRSAVPGRVSAPAGGLGIVDYAQDEGLALSPESEDGEFFGSGSGMGDDSETQPDNGFVRESPSGKHTPSPGDVPALQPDNGAEGSTLKSTEAENIEDKPREAVEGEQVPEFEAMELDIVNDFLPPPPTGAYSGELQTKFSKYLALKKTGKSLNEQLRNTKGYRNPDFLQSAVRHYDIDHIGTCFQKEIFDPHGFDKADYYESIALEIRRDADRKEQERRQSQRVDFSRSSIQLGAMAGAKPIVPIVHKVVTVTTTETSVKTDGRTTKKSKWDKVELEGGRTSQAISNAADAMAAANAHAALLTASANAGAGYASFAQQRRREVEEKLRTSEKISLSGSSKLERKTDRS